MTIDHRPDPCAGWPTPLRETTRVSESRAGHITTVTPIRAEEECFVGHYPDFPILPGVLIVETAHRAVRHYAARRLARAARLRVLHRVRFFGPVFPGDELTTECGLTLDGDHLTATVRCRTATARVASIRAGYDARPLEGAETADSGVNPDENPGYAESQKPDDTA